MNVSGWSNACIITLACHVHLAFLRTVMWDVQQRAFCDRTMDRCEDLNRLVVQASRAWA